MGLMLQQLRRDDHLPIRRSVRGGRVRYNLGRHQWLQDGRCGPQHGSRLVECQMDLTEETRLQYWHGLNNTHARIFQQAIVWDGAKSQFI